MSNSNRGDYSGILVAGIITFLIIFAMIGYFFGIDKNLDLEHEKHAEHEQRETSKDIERYCFHAGFLSRKCAEDQIEAYRATHDGNEDLSAQKEMAFWAKWLLILTTFTTGVSILAVVYVAQTLKATRDTVEVTREIGEAQVRAYLTVVEARFILGEIISFEAVYFNSGATPAKNIRIEVELTFDNGEVATPLTKFPSDVPSGKSISRRIDLFPKPDDLFKKMPPKSTIGREGFGLIRFKVTLEFEDVFKQKISEELKFHGVFEAGQGERAILLDNLNGLTDEARDSSIRIHDPGKPYQ